MHDKSVKYLGASETNKPKSLRGKKKGGAAALEKGRKSSDLLEGVSNVQKDLS